MSGDHNMHQKRIKNKDDIIRMAREAGLNVGPAGMGQTVWGDDTNLERFFNMAQAAEREACAKVCDVIDDGRKDLAAECAEAIRARGQDPAPEPKRSSMTWVLPKIHPVMEYRFRRGRGFI
jgi:hypothetical protein